MSSVANSLKLYTCTTPNGYKVSILLELLGLKYDFQYINIRENEQKQEWFLKLNPNGRIPTLVDSTADGDIIISETAAIMQYLVDKYDTKHKLSYPVGTKEYYLQLETLYFQMAGLGPMQGQANHFVRFAPEKIPYGITRYTEETKRLYSVLEEYLARNSKNGSLYLVGDHYSISDIAVFPWASGLRFLEIDVAEYPLVSKWYQTLAALPEVQKGLTIPKPSPF
ncbi:hypothetical protein BABINDRAFT_161329 [Babjeviella inositovora NRRL Y-12698]|uniref:Glutathione S-transferase n=1 Tax=Babjeviella inositovora NRRL Y-12698 TaxID=984486 RepID=A0A1E3QRS6_9ASCO|nr:uncharacterized protein BABINDRAFT_161329 [Babjeviella inositovora NRRL Y-12698]ODQ80381.1 hypothetical protein BABINDRAFT_161329 [Babjeviella inositovora NRRL Y-12698]